MVTHDLKEPATNGADLSRLLHQLNNQLSIILANAELLENRLTDPHRARASQVVAGALEAIDTVRGVRQLTEAAE